jgi:hypothetical protein
MHDLPALPGACGRPLAASDLIIKDEIWDALDLDSTINKHALCLQPLDHPSQRHKPDET